MFAYHCKHLWRDSVMVSDTGLVTERLRVRHLEQKFNQDFVTGGCKQEPGEGVTHGYTRDLLT